MIKSSIKNNLYVMNESFGIQFIIEHQIINTINFVIKIIGNFQFILYASKHRTSENIPAYN